MCLMLSLEMLSCKFCRFILIFHFEDRTVTLVMGNKMGILGRCDEGMNYCGFRKDFGGLCQIFKPFYSVLLFLEIYPKEISMHKDLFIG